MTRRLYYTDSYLKEFTSRVASREDEGRRVTLEQTAFYPTSGGQQFDTGFLDESAVVDVVDEGDRIVHVLAEPITGGSVSGRINWPRRFDHMQQHTGQHIVSAVFEDLFGFRTASVHFGTESSSVDLETERVSGMQLLDAEQRANEVVFENRKVVTSLEDAALVHGLRKPPPREGELRVISIEGLDRSACGGTHVSSTGEIGCILFRRTDRMHGNARIEFVCGVRALRAARADFEVLSRAATALGVTTHEAADRIAAINEALRASERTRRKREEELAALRVRALHDRAVPGRNGIRFIVERCGPEATMDEVRPLAHAATELPLTMFAGLLESSSQIIVAASADTGVDAGKALKAALAAQGGRGGGSARVAQGSLAAEKMDAVIEQLQSVQGLR